MMKYLYNIRRALFALGCLAPLAAANTAYGNDRGVRGIMVPPAGCQPYVGASYALFSGNAWTILQGSSATLSCPLSFNNVDLGGTSADNDITRFRIHYQIPFTFGEVYVQLIRSEVLAGRFVSSVVCGGRVIPTTTDPTETTVACAHDVAGDGVFYSFAIILKQPLSAPPPVFIGIDFP